MFFVVSRSKHKDLESHKKANMCLVGIDHFAKAV